MSAKRQFAIVTGASTGIGLELAKCCSRGNFDLLVAADEPEIEAAATEMRAMGAVVETVQADLSTIEGSTGCMKPQSGSADRSMHCWPMPAGVSDTRSSIRTSIRQGW